MRESRLTSDEARKLLQLKESHFLDFKDCRIRPARLTETISAFANADGGELYVGISEVDGELEWNGFSDIEAANGHLQALETLFPLGQFFRYEFVSGDSHKGYLLFVQIAKNPAVVKASNGVLYLRRGAQNLPQATPEQHRQLELNKGLSSFETETVKTDLGVVSESEIMHSFIAEVVPAAEPEQWLRKQRLISEDKPTVAGVVLFADIPQAILPKRCAVKIYRYNTSEKEGTRDALAFQPLTVEGCLYRQIGESVRQTKRLIEGEQRRPQSTEEEMRYPDETLHEIITNALLHRDYSIADDVHVRIFNNRVEVESPGLLAGHVTERNIYNERFARNGNLVRIINKFPNPPNKDIGEGLRTARDAMAVMKLRAPEVKQRENSVVVFIRHEPIAPAESIIMEFVENRGSIMNSDVRRICYVTQSKAWNIVRTLLDRNVLERIPGTARANTAYRKATRGSQLPTPREANRQLGRERKEKVLEYLKRNGSISTPILLREFGIPSPTSYNLLKKLEAAGDIRQLPGRRNRAAIYVASMSKEGVSL
jgi:ATP-dependent DNA helicase RecG